MRNLIKKLRAFFNESPEVIEKVVEKTIEKEAQKQKTRTYRQVLYVYDATTLDLITTFKSRSEYIRSRKKHINRFPPKQIVKNMNNGEIISRKKLSKDELIEELGNKYTIDSFKGDNKEISIYNNIGELLAVVKDIQTFRELLKTQRTNTYSHKIGSSKSSISNQRRLNMVYTNKVFNAPKTSQNNLNKIKPSTGSVGTGIFDLNRVYTSQ